MAEYIERDEAINAVFGAMADGRAVFPALNNLPAADVRPVVRGKWIRMDMHKGMEQYKCAVCRSECYVPECMGEPMHAFCPNCGAMMEEI